MKVLIPYDGADLAEQAAVMTIELLAQHRLDLVLLRVASSPEQTEAACVSLEQAATRIGASPATVTPVLAFGRPDQEIIRCADERGADLIAMSTHGRSDLVRMLVGSVTDRVIRTSPVPVLVFHPPTMSVDHVSPPAGRKLRLLAPLDGSQGATEALDMAIALLRPESIEVSLVSAISTPQRETPLAQEILDASATRLAARGVTVSTSILLGEAANQIATLAAEGTFDLIVMSTHGHGALTRALVGSVTDRVVRTSEVPVLVIQPHSMEAPFDPVSGEEVDPDATEHTSEYHGRTYLFTTFEHKLQFDGAPEAYVGRRLARPTAFPTAEEGLAEQYVFAPPVT